MCQPWANKRRTCLLAQRKPSNLRPTWPSGWLFYIGHNTCTNVGDRATMHLRAKCQPCILAHLCKALLRSAAVTHQLVSLAKERQRCCVQAAFQEIHIMRSRDRSKGSKSALRFWRRRAVSLSVKSWCRCVVEGAYVEERSAKLQVLNRSYSLVSFLCRLS